MEATIFYYDNNKLVELSFDNSADLVEAYLQANEVDKAVRVEIEDTVIDINTAEAILDASNQEMAFAYWQSTSSTDWDEAFAGEYDSEAAFAEAYCEEGGDLGKLPNFIRNHIDWQGVWNSTLRHEYFEAGGFYFQNL